MNWSLYRHSFSLSVNILVLKPWKWVWMSVNLWVCYCGIYGSSLSFACSKYYVSCNRALQQEVIFPGVLLTLPLPGHKVQVNVFYFLRTSPTHRQALCQLTPSRKQRQQTSLWFSQLWNRNILASVINPFQPTLQSNYAAYTNKNEWVILRTWSLILRILLADPQTVSLGDSATSFQI